MWFQLTGILIWRRNMFIFQHSYVVMGIFHFMIISSWVSNFCGLPQKYNVSCKSQWVDFMLFLLHIQKTSTS
jgi:hypothetical protein